MKLNGVKLGFLDRNYEKEPNLIYNNLFALPEF